MFNTTNNEATTTMTTQLSPLKVDQETDNRINHLSHFLDRTKKDIVAEAVALLWSAKAETIQAELSALYADVQKALDNHDGSEAASVTLLTGFDARRLEELGGVDG